MTLFRDTNNIPRQQIRIDALKAAAGCTEQEARNAIESLAPLFYQHHIAHQQTLTPLDGVRMALARLEMDLPDKIQHELAE